LNWPTVRLGAIAEVEREGIDPDRVPLGTNYVGLEHILSDGSISRVLKVAPGDLASTKFAFSDKHVLFGKLRPYLRKTARPSFTGICSTDIIPLRLPRMSIGTTSFISSEPTKWLPGLQPCHQVSICRASVQGTWSNSISPSRPSPNSDGLRRSSIKPTLCAESND
jgi:hypothetical protein